ncbi:MAG: TIGR03435 family protein [Acidobacteria bacterium]|nr:TIGR03435 family protein [Acidobacteriota bacterium]
MTPILKLIFSLWNSGLPFLANHLWQSTLVVVAAAMVTLTLRTHSARIRYTVWLAASLKFLLPFSLLTAIGSWLGPKHTTAVANSGIYLVVEFTQPFTQPGVSAPVTAAVHITPLFPWKEALLSLWLSGFVAVLSLWIVRWLRMSAARRNGIILREGRELSSLRTLQHATGITPEIKLLQSSASVEPGIFGILHPVLLWPSSISEHLDDSHLVGVLAHELFHVQRQDNLAAALHMLVQSIFWFHPLVWWLGARLIEERERACDESVIAMGNRRHTYAESILKVCEFCLSSPLTCVSGVTGADLKKRMVHVMTDRVVRKLNLSRKLLLWTAACLALALPIVYGLFNPAPGRAESALGFAPKYTIVSIKPHPEDNNGVNRAKIMVSLKDASLMARGISPQALIQLAYRVQDTEVVGTPDWLGSLKFDIDASVDKAVADQLQKLNEDQRGILAQPLLQGLLADQFKLKVHQETRELPAYLLTVAEGGSKMQKQSDDKHGMMHMGTGELSSQGTPLDLLSAQLSMRLGRPVVDKTGLTGNYAYSLHWTPDADERTRMQQKELIAPDSSASDESAPPLSTAIQEQLGLTLQPVTTRVQVLVVDHIEQPSEQ